MQGILQLGATTSEYDTGNKLLVIAGELNLIIHLLHNHLGTGVDDAGKCLDINLTRSLTADTRYRDDIILAHSLHKT